ncbi:MAG: hypothetical protein WDM96_18430 [Lacunisphaera sp.]
MSERAARAFDAAEREQHVQDEHGVAKPEALVGVRAGIHLVRRVQHDAGARLVEEPLDPGVGDFEPGESAEGGRPIG